MSDAFFNAWVMWVAGPVLLVIFVWLVFRD